MARLSHVAVHPGAFHALGARCGMHHGGESRKPDLFHGPATSGRLAVNRLSIGVQSFDDHVLGILGRAHDAQGAKRAIACARERFDNVSVDLLCAAFPVKSIESFEDSVKTAIECGVFPTSACTHSPSSRIRPSMPWSCPGSLKNPMTTSRPRHAQAERIPSPRLDTSATKWQAARNPGSSAVTTCRLLDRAFLIWVWGAARPA